MPFDWLTSPPLRINCPKGSMVEGLTHAQEIQNKV